MLRTNDSYSIMQFKLLSCAISLANPGGKRDPAHLGQICFIYMQFSVKLWPNNRLALPCLGNPVSATEFFQRSALEQSRFMSLIYWLMYVTFDNC